MIFSPLRAAGLALALTLGVGVLTGCDKVDEAFDCQTICNEFKRCFDADLNLNTCEDRCFDAIDADATLDADADECVVCISDKACNEVMNGCSTCQPVFSTFTSAS